MAELTKEGRIRKELLRLNKIFKHLPSNKYAIAKPLIDNAAFMRVTLEDLQADINREGTCEDYQNGENQKGVKMSAAMQAYNTMMKNYNTVSARLELMLPPDERTSKIDAFLKGDS